MKKILLDTSFLLDMVRFKISLEEIGDLIYGKYQIFIPVAVVSEVEKNPTKHAKAALKLIKDLKVLPTDEKLADRAILSLADKDTLVATNDRQLRKKLKERGIKTIYLRAKKYLAIG